MIEGIICAITFVALLFVNKARKKWKLRAQAREDSRQQWVKVAQKHMDNVLMLEREIKQLESIREAQQRVIENREYQVEVLKMKKKKNKKPQPKAKRK